jgi:hypothetical protein
MKVANYVNEAKRTCVVVISDCENDVRRRVRKLIENKYGDHIGFRGEFSYLNGPIRGKAKCSELDTFSAETGLKIARARAFNKYNDKYNEELQFLREELESLVDDLYDLDRNEWEDETEYFPPDSND